MAQINLLPWRETGARIELVPMAANGDFDYEFLERKLEHFSKQNCLKVGAFSAGSNITGTLFDVDRIACLCHAHDALADARATAMVLPALITEAGGLGALPEETLQVSP